MAHSFTYLLFKLKLIEPSKDTILDWMSTHAINKLEHALKHGNYQTRQYAAEALGQVGQCSSVPVLLYAIEDNIQNVSIAALNALEALECGDNLIISITRKRFKWLQEIRDKNVKRQNKTQKKYNVYRWERSSKKSFEMVKERLKRPIR